MATFPSYQQNQAPATTGYRVAWPTPVFPQADIPALIQDPQTGVVYLNPRKSTQKWTYLSADPYPLTVAANGTLTCSLTPPLEEGNAGDMEVVKLMSVQTGRFSVILEDTVTQKKLMNRPVPNNMVFGTSQFPFVLYETLFLKATSSLIAYCTDLTGSSNSIRLVVEGRRFAGCGPRQTLWQAFDQRKTHPYWLTFDDGAEVTVAANTTTSYTMTVPTAADFNCWLIMDDSATDYRIRILDGSSGRTLMLGPGETGVGGIDMQDMVASTTSTVTGLTPANTKQSGAFPHVWTFTHLFKRGTRIIFECQNTTGSQITIRAALHGQLVYYNDCPGFVDPSQARLLQQAMVPMPAPAAWVPCASAGCPAPPEPIPGLLPTGTIYSGGP